MARNRLRWFLSAVASGLALPFTCLAAIQPNVAVEVPPDSPVLLVSTDFGSYSGNPATADGSDVHARLFLRNVGNKPIAGLTFRVQSNISGSEGQASLVLPSVEAVAGAVFPVRLDLQLPRRTAIRNQAPSVRIALDAVLFRDLSLYGPDSLHSRRSLTIYESEARREQDYLQRLLSAGRLSEIRQELNFGLPEEQPQLRMELLPFQIPEYDGKPLTVQPVVFEQAPVTIVGGGALQTEAALIGPHVLVRNNAQKRVRSLDVGLILRDERGHEARISTLPAQLTIEPEQTRVLQQRVAMLLSRVKGQPIVVRSLAAYVVDAEFDDGSMWIPSRKDIERATDSIVLRRTLAECPEMERMSGIFRRAGISGIEAELKATR